MALAGDMKLKNFLAIAGGVVVLGTAGLCGGTWWLGDQALESVEQAEPVVAAPAPVAAPVAAPAPAPVEAPAPPEPSGLSGHEQAVMAYNGKNLGSKKLKDVSRGQPYKINVYQDDGNTTANRAKVDLDRDEKWDEKWTFKSDGVQRKIAPADDENYTKVVVWNGKEWVAE